MKNILTYLKCRKAIILILFPFLSSVCQAQSEEELLAKLSSAEHDTDNIKIYIALHNAVYKTDVAKAEEYANQIVRTAQNSNHLTYEMTGYKGLARCAKKNWDYNKVLHYDTLEMQTARKINTPVALYSAHMDFATDYIEADKYANVLPHLQACAAIAKKQKNDSNYAKVENRLGWYYKNRHQYSKSLPHFEIALATYLQFNDQKMIVNTERGYAESLLILGKTEKVPAMIFDAIEYHRNANAYQSLAECLVLSGQSHFRNGNYSSGLENLLEAKKFFSVHKNLADEGSVTVDIAASYLLKNDFKKAMVYGKEALKLLQSANYEYGLTTMNTFWGQYYLFLKKLDSADHYFKKADLLAKKNNLQDRETENLRYWAVLKYMKKDKQAGDSLILRYTERIVKERDPVSVAYDIKKYIRYNHITDTGIINSLSQTYLPGGVQKLRNTLKAANSFPSMSYDTILLSPSNIIPYYEDSIKELMYYRVQMELNTKYNAKQKDDSLKMQQQAIKINKAKLEQRKIFIISIAGIALLLAGGIWLQYKSRRRAERDKAKIELLQNEIHHRVKNNLAVINRLVEVAGKNSVEDAPLATLKNRIKSIELLHNHLYSNEAKTGNISLQSYFEDLCLAIAATFQTAKDIQINVQAPTEVDSTIAEKLGLILNELVTNSFKYAFENKEAGSITITAKPEGKNLNLSVQDNGVGMPTEKSTKSYGMKLIKGLSNELNGKFSFQNMGGTSFQLSIPVSA